MHIYVKLLIFTTTSWRERIKTTLEGNKKEFCLHWGQSLTGDQICDKDLKGDLEILGTKRYDFNDLCFIDDKLYLWMELLSSL